MEPWYKRTFLWGQVNLTEDDPFKCDPESWRDYWKRSGVEGIIINCGGIVSYYQSRFSFQYKAKKLEGRDYFGMWNKTAREAGLSVIARMDINCTTEAAYRKHPEWYCRDREGNPILIQGRYATCVNGGYYQKFIPEVFREIIDLYHPDGFADNSWAGLGRNMVCYCENCRKQFETDYASRLPDKADWEDPVYRKWVRWSYEIRVRNWRYFNLVTSEYGGSSCKWFGMLCADPFSVGERFYDIRRLAEDMPFLFCDQQSRDGMTGFEMNSVNGAFLRRNGDNERIIAESMAHYYKGARTFRLSAGCRQEIRKWMLTGVSGGLAPWFHFVGGSTRDPRRLELTDDLFLWLSGCKTYFRDRVNIADVGVVWNQESIIYYGRDNSAVKSAAYFRGIAMGLSEAGIPFVPIHADDIGAYKEQLQLLILPNVAILNEQQEEMLLDWLREGKNLIITGDTGLWGPEGEWKGAGRLYEKLGINVGKETVGTVCTGGDNWMIHDTHSYLEIDDPIFDFMQKLEKTSLLPFGGVLRETQNNGKLQPICTYVPAFPIYPPEFSWIREKSNLTAVYAGILENGARVVYVPADLDRCFGLYHIADHGKLLEGAARWAGGDRFPVRIQAAGHVNCDIYSKEGRILIHLVNLAGCRVPVGTLEENLPIGPVKLILRLNRKIDRVYGLVSGRDFIIDNMGEEARVQLPQLDEHELLIIDLSQEERK